MANIGLVLSGGGARAAYQVGAIRALAEIAAPGQCPFRIVAGLSAGAINCMALAIGADDFQAAAERLSNTWAALTPDRVYRTRVSTLATTGIRWAKDLSTGGLFGKSRANHLLDTTPLYELLQRELDTVRVREHIASGLIRGVAVTTTNYATGTTVTFFDGVPSIEPWARRSRVAIRERIGIDHVMASAAIPIFFPPVRLGNTIHGDGGVRMTAPISPAIHLGAEKVLSIGIRYLRPVSELTRMNLENPLEVVTLAEIAGVMLNAVFLESLDNDVERLERVNRTLSAIPEDVRKSLRDPLRRIPSLALRPSKDLGGLASDQYQQFPAVLRHLLRGIGASSDKGWELVSYLAFQPEYVQRLMELGYEDTLARRHEIAAFLEGPSMDSAPPSELPPRVVPR